MPPESRDIAKEVTGAFGDIPGSAAADVYEQLRSLAQSWMRRERANHTLSATALVHEAYMKLGDQTKSAWSSPEDFFAAAATVFRHILVDHARAKMSLKRGGNAGRVTLSEVDSKGLAKEEAGPDLLELDEALRGLSAVDARAARVVELRYFGGVSVERTATLLEVSVKTVKNDWAFARAWLKTRLES